MPGQRSGHLSHERGDPTKPGGEGPLDVLLFQEQLVQIEDRLRETVLLKLQGLENRQIAERLDMSQSGVTRMLAPMEKVGWVARAEDRRDARVSCVVLRKSGRRLAREGLRTLAAQSEALFGETWSTDDVRTLAGLLGRLTAQLPGKLQA